MTCPDCKGTGQPYEVNFGIICTCACGLCPTCHGAGEVDEAKHKADQDAMRSFFEHINDPCPKSDIQKLDTGTQNVI